MRASAASSPPPIIPAPTSPCGFYWMAPLILLGVYFTAPYLQRLWRDLPHCRPCSGREALDRKLTPGS
jgi:hypothetical protein